MIPGSTRRALAALLTTALLAAQQASPPSQPPEPILRVSVTLVQVDAVVTDAKGKPVPDLTSDDFELLQDGRRQKITNFSYVGDAPPIETATMPASAVTAA